MKRKAAAQWRGTLKEGNGIVNTDSRVLSHVPYSFATRFESMPGTNPEELIGAALSGCFAMAMSGELEKKGLRPESIDVQATVAIDKEGAGFAINQIHLDVSASVPGANASQVEEAANIAKANCPVSKLLKANITMKFNFISQPGETFQTGPH